MDFYEMPPGAEAPEIVNVIVEIPKGTRNKIEYDPTDRVFRLDRVLYSPVYYPGDYGFIPGTLSKDGDALDVLVLVTDPTFTGCVLQARPIGVHQELHGTGSHGDDRTATGLRFQYRIIGAVYQRRIRVEIARRVKPPYASMRHCPDKPDPPFNIKLGNPFFHAATTPTIADENEHGI